jgi:hypothetical protein
MAMSKEYTLRKPEKEDDDNNNNDDGDGDDDDYNTYLHVSKRNETLPMKKFADCTTLLHRMHTLILPNYHGLHLKHLPQRPIIATTTTTTTV